MIKEITNKDEWENFLAKCEQKSFLSSWQWGEFWRIQQNTIKRLGLVENSQLIAVILAVKIRARRGTYILVQHGPNILETALNHLPQILEEFYTELKKWAKTENALFIRTAPLIEKNDVNVQIFKKAGFKTAPMHANAYEATWKLNLAPSEEELLKGMRKTTRYLIRQTQKNDAITIEKTANPQKLKIYSQLNKAVAKRQKFIPFKEEYIQREFETFAADNQAMWFIGYYQNQAVAAALIIFWSGIGFYHQAASLGEFSKFSVPYLLQWEAIKEAKRRGCKIYDFWGFTDPKLYPKHPWAGPTLFKMGFGGRKFEYIATQDYILSPKYWFTYIFEKMRRFKRKL